MASMAGSFLVAKPKLQDPNFRQAVVLLLEHGDQGAFGVVVNRPTKMKSLPFPVFTGGPCSEQGLRMIHGHEEWIGPDEDEEAVNIAPGVYLGDASCLKFLGDPDPEITLRFRMFNGYAGWGADQLEQELVNGSWMLVAANAELLFDVAPEDLWDHLMPTTIPQPSVN
jgi:putative transcriptional regulator